MLRTDVRLQIRHGFYAAYGFVAVVYIVLLRVLPPDIRVVAVPPLLLSEASVIGFFFAGTLLHLERGDGTLAALAVAPIRPVEYILSKAVSLSILTALVALAIAGAALGGHIDAVLLALAAALTAAVFVACGLAAASHFSALDRFAVWGGFGSAVFALPVLPYLGMLDSPLWMLIPTYPTLALLGRAVGVDGIGTVGTAVHLLALVAWTVAASLLARRWLVRHAFGRRGRAE